MEQSLHGCSSQVGQISCAVHSRGSSQHSFVGTQHTLQHCWWPHGQRKRVSRCGLSLNINTTLYLCSVFFPRSSSLYRHYVINPQSIALWYMAHSLPLPFFTVMETWKSVMEPSPLVLSPYPVPWKKDEEFFRLGHYFLGGIWEDVSVRVHLSVQCL